MSEADAHGLGNRVTKLHSFVTVMFSKDEQSGGSLTHPDLSRA